MRKYFEEKINYLQDINKAQTFPHFFSFKLNYGKKKYPEGSEYQCIYKKKDKWGKLILLDVIPVAYV